MCTSLIHENKKVVMNIEVHNLQYVSHFIFFGTKECLVTTFYVKNFLTAWASFGSTVYDYVVPCVVHINMASNVAIVRVECSLVFWRSWKSCLHLKLSERASWLKFPWTFFVPPGKWQVSTSNYATTTSFHIPSYSLLVKHLGCRRNIFWGNGSSGK